MNKKLSKTSKRLQVLPFSKIFMSELAEWTTENETAYQDMIKGGWYILKKESDSVFIKTAKGEIVEIRADGTEGFHFALGYLRSMARNYKGHLQAMDALLRLHEEKAYTLGMTFPNLHFARLAVQSLNCCFGGSEFEQDADKWGELYPKMIECPIKSICKFCGVGNRINQYAGCNPVYELDLPSRQVELADLLVNTGYDLSDIAQMMEVTECYIRKKASEIYEKMEVANRKELRLLLRNKRLR